MAKKADQLVPGVGLDVGTANIVVSRMDEAGNFVNRSHRNMLFELEDTEDTQELLERGSYPYAKSDGRCYVIGHDAMALASAMAEGKIVRPMRHGLLNPLLHSSQQLLFHIIKELLGAPLQPGEPLRFSVPANPVDQPGANNLFHQMVIGKLLENIGFSPKPLNEAMGVIYDLAPVMVDEDGAKSPLTGWGVSMGGGMINCAGALKGMSVCEFSMTKCGDYIDEQAAAAVGLPVQRVTKIKERDLDLANPDFSNNVVAALSVYYDETINRAVKMMSRQLRASGTTMDGACEIVVAGGSAMIPGVVERFKAAVDTQELPFAVSNVRCSEHPFHSVVQGMCLRARSDWEKSNKKG